MIVFTVLPLSIMLVVYPVTVVKLVRQKIPGNGKSSIDTMRKKQNIRLTKMFVTIILVFVFTCSSYYAVSLIALYSNSNKGCALHIIQCVLRPFRALYHAVNPICLWFCSSYRQEIKRIFLHCSKSLTN